MLLAIAALVWACTNDGGNSGSQQNPTPAPSSSSSATAAPAPSASPSQTAAPAPETNPNEGRVFTVSVLAEIRWIPINPAGLR